MGQRLRHVGLILLVGGLVGLTIPIFFDQPPDIRNLHSEPLELAKTPFVRQAAKAGSIGLLCFKNSTLRLPNICKFWKCEIPEHLLNIAPGTTLAVWRDGITIWQVQHEGKIIYSYAQALQSNRDEKHRQYVIYLLLSLIGVIIFSFNRDKSAS